jgi:hypothetical protein
MFLNLDINYNYILITQTTYSADIQIASEH